MKLEIFCWHIEQPFSGEEFSKDLVWIQIEFSPLRHNVKNVRPEGSTVLYVQRLGTAFFQQVGEACREFDKCFPGQK